MNVKSREALLYEVAQNIMRWPFRLRAFGEGVALRGLLAAYKFTGNPEYLGYVRGMAFAYIGSGVARSPEDHTSPCHEFLELYRITGEKKILDACLQLADLHQSFPENQHGAKIHRHDQPGWSGQIWVDCMDIDAPFLTALARVTQRHEFCIQGVQEILAYAQLLQDETTGLFWHGHDQSCGRNGQIWARGNGWALLGLVDSLREMDSTDEGYTELSSILERLAEGIAVHQSNDGLWHTLICDSASYQETTLAAMAVYGLRSAIVHGLLDRSRFQPVADKAFAAVLRYMDTDGVLAMVSSATPIGEAKMYATRPFGIYPWGQGPLLLMLCGVDHEDH